MNQYKIFKHPLGSTVAVKIGWSWPAFFFGFIWAMVKKMWGLGMGVLFGFFALELVVFIASGVLGSNRLITTQIGGQFMTLAVIIANFIFGKNGNSWNEKSLESRGFEQVDIITASNSEGAIALYLKVASNQ